MTDLHILEGDKIASFVSGSWKELLRVKDVSQSDSFFDLGGTSLAAMKFITTVENEYGMDVLSPEELYSDPIYATIVALIEKNVSR